MDMHTDLKPAKHLAMAITLICGACAISVPTASADIVFEDRGDRFSLDVRDEAIADVMDELAERFDFDVDGYPEHWSDEPMSFSATGDLERVLRSLLKDTSHVFEYRTDLETNTTRITSLKLLNEGVDGFVANPSGAPDSPKAPGAAGANGASSERSGVASLGQSRDSQGADLPTDARDSASGASPAGSSAASAPNVSGLSQSLASRARQASGNAAPAPTPDSATNTSSAPASSSSASSSASSSTSTNNPATNVSEAEMRALTQRALKDVQGLADALRKAEGN